MGDKGTKRYGRRENGVWENGVREAGVCDPPVFPTVHIYVDLKAKCRKNSNVFVVDVNYFRKPLKGGVPYVFARDTKQLVPILTHPYLVTEFMKFYKMKDKAAACKEIAKFKHSTVLIMLHQCAVMKRTCFIGVWKMLKIGVQSLARRSFNISPIDCTRFLLT